MSEPRTGSCLCGSVSFRVDGPLGDVLHCHCENCRRLTGNFIAATRAMTDDIVFENQASLAWHDLGFAKYGFCGACGSTLFFVPADRTDQTSITAGTLDDVSDLDLGSVWFAGEAQAHNVLPPDVPHYAGNG